MKAFISHAFGGGDEQLANALKKDLGAAGIAGYLAEKAKRYDLLISDKIRQEIDESDWLVAVITRRSHMSASVHEEVGYALGKGVRVALMVEEGVEKSGVLVHGREYEAFSVPKFGEHSRRMARFIAGSPRPAPRPDPVGEAAKRLLEGRRILSAEAGDFAQNDHYGQLYNGAVPDDKKPAFLFTALPHNLGEYADVTTAEFGEWVESVRHLEVQGFRIPVRETERKIDIGALQVVRRHSPANIGQDVLAYREFQNNGFFEYGTSHSFLGRSGTAELSLYLWRMVVEFWGFIVHARSFYRKIGMRGRFTVMLSIKNSSDLALVNIGDEAADSSPAHASRLLPDPQSPRTARRNIQVSQALAPADALGDAEIADAARRAARTVCNAYGASAPKCCDSNGRFAWKLWGRVRS